MNLADWEPKLLPEELVKLTDSQRRAKTAGVVMLASVIASVVIPFAIIVAMPVMFVTIILLMWWTWKASRGQVTMQQIADALQMQFHERAPAQYHEALLVPNNLVDYEIGSAIVGNVGMPAPVPTAVFTATQNPRSTSSDRSAPNQLMVAVASVAMPVRFLRIERRTAGQALARRALTVTGLTAGLWERSWSVPTREISTESVAFNEAWRVSVHQDDDPITAMRMLSPEIISAFVDNRVPFTQSLVYQDGQIAIVDLRDLLFARQVDYLLSSVVQQARFARVLARAAGMRDAPPEQV